MIFDIFKNLFKKKEIEEIPVYNLLPKHFIVSKKYPEFMLYLSIEHKFLIISLDDIILDIIFNKYKNIAKNKKNHIVLENMVKAFLKKCVVDAELDLGYKNISMTLYKNSVRYFLDPVIMADCKADISLIINMVYINFEILLDGLNALNDSLHIHSTIGSDIEEIKDIILNDVISLINKKRGIRELKS